jgi:pyrimidine operon attenuation protein / uracil phosphoribosyltransferase
VSDSPSIALDAAAVQVAFERVASYVLNIPGPLAVIGVRRGGVHLAERLGQRLAAAGRQPPPSLGVLDIALYRDDAFVSAHRPKVGPTEISFSIEGRPVVLCDDVLYTGRTIRAALDELMDFGRPQRVYLAVLIDRGGRELPITADIAGATLQVPSDASVEVHFREEGGTDEVRIEPRARGEP